MAVTDYSKTAADNTSLNGKGVSNNTIPSQVDDLVRELMADIAKVNDGTTELTRAIISGKVQFETRAAAEAGNTGAADFLTIGNDVYAYDATGVALTTGDARTWRLVTEGITQNIPENYRLNIIAHRGGRDVSVQNTMPAFTGCLRWADEVEMDVSVTSDGDLKLFHDETVDSLTDGTGTFTALTTSYINGLQFSALSGKAIQPLVRIPDFADVLAWAVQNGVKIWPEMKRLRSESDVDLVAQAVLDAKAERQTVLSSFVKAEVTRALDYDTGIQCGYLFDSAGSEGTVQGHIDDLAAYPRRGWIILNQTLVTTYPGLVEYARGRLVGLAVYTIDTEAQAEAVKDLGVQNIIADLPVKRGKKQ